jgi:hypothetical protein
VPARDSTDEERLVNAFEQRLLATGLIFNLLTLLVLAPGWLPAATVASAERRQALAAVYGADPARTQAAVRASSWPQVKDNWCGVATIAAVAQYRGFPYSQADVALWMDSPAAVSEWGHPSWNGAGPGFKADIARDSGTDPRSLAAALDATAHGWYRQLVVQTGRQDATSHLVADLVRTQEPISVIVLHGQHSVLVSGVLATADPVQHPESIVGLQVWDPGANSPYGQIQPSQETDVPLSQWLGLWVYWATPYNANYYGALPIDPDPAVGPYTYDPARGLTTHLWIGNYVYLQPDTTSGLTVDWAYKQNGTLIPGARGEVPTPVPTPTAPPTATPLPTAPLTPVATAATTPAPGIQLGPVSVCVTGPDCAVPGRIPWWALGILTALLALLLAGASVRLATRAQVSGRRGRRASDRDEREEALVGSSSRGDPQAGDRPRRHGSGPW